MKQNRVFSDWLQSLKKSFTWGIVYQVWSPLRQYICPLISTYLGRGRSGSSLSRAGPDLPLPSYLPSSSKDVPGVLPVGHTQNTSQSTRSESNQQNFSICSFWWWEAATKLLTLSLWDSPPTTWRKVISAILYSLSHSFAFYITTHSCWLQVSPLLYFSPFDLLCGSGCILGHFIFPYMLS